jgi:3',5'-cyclic AMP phosphodiesterase CpdA
MTRRTLLASAGVAGAALLLGARRSSSAEAAPPEPLVLALVADTHLGKAGAQDPAADMAEAVAEINASPAEMTLFLGDLVDAGATHEALYADWLKIAGGLKQPYYAIPGNHDPAAIFTKHVRPETDYVVDVKDLRLIFFADASPESHDGAITAEQLKWLAAKVDEAAAARRRVILCTHIPRHPNEAPDMGWYIRKPRADLETLVKSHAGTIIALSSGHLHSGLRGWTDTAGVPEIAVPSCLWNFQGDLAKAGGFSTRDQRRGYAVAEVGADKLTLRYKPTGAAALDPVVLDLPKKA